MTQENKKSIWLDPSVNIVMGTKPRELEALRRSLAHKNNDNNYHASDKYVLFDSRRTVSPGNAVLSDKEQDVNDLFSPDEFVDATLPVAAASLAEHEENGDFNHMPKLWYKNPRAALDNFGADGDQNVGYSLASVAKKNWIPSLQKAFGNCIGHEKRLHGAINGMVTTDVVYRIIVRFLLSAPGGMGSGAISRAYEYVRDVTAEYGIDPKFIVEMLLRGTLAVKDRQKTNINETNILKDVRAWASNEYIDPITGDKINPFDIVFLQSNQNCGGRFASLEQLLMHEAYRHTIMWHSPVNLKVRERLVDIENVRYDKNGDPLIGYTAAVSGIHHNSETITDYCANKAVGMSATVLVRKPDAGKARNDAVAFARMHGIVESQDESHLTNRILAPDELKGENLVGRLTSNFSVRTKGRWGINRARAFAETFNSIKGVELTSIYESAMIKDADKKTGAVIAALDEAIRQRATAGTDTQNGAISYSGIPELLGYIKEVLVLSAQAVTGKIGPVQEPLQLHQDAVNQALFQLAQIEQMSWFGRARSLLLLHEISSCLEESGLAQLLLELQILVCKVANSNVLNKLIEYVDGKIMKFTVLSQDLRHISAASKQRAQRLGQRNTGYDAVPFLELENQHYLEHFFDEKVAAHGGDEALIANLIARLVQKHDSLTVLLGKDVVEIEKILMDVCRDVFEPPVAQTDVVAEFKKTFPDPKHQIRIIRSLILQSQGGVHTVGEVGTDTVWLKFATVPTEDDVKWLRDILEKADPKAGVYDIIVDGDSATIKILQLRGGISLSPIIAKANLDNPDDWEKIVEYTVDRTAAMIVPPNPTDRQLRMVIAKGIVTGQLNWDQNRGFSLAIKDHDPIRLGNTANEASERLRRWWPYLVAIESTLTHHIFLDDTKVSDAVEKLEEAVMSKDNSDTRIAMIDKTAVSDVKKQLEFLIPWAKRLRIGTKKAVQ